MNYFGFVIKTSSYIFIENNYYFIDICNNKITFKINKYII